MNLVSISLRNMRIRALSTSLTTMSVALGAALLATLWLLLAEAERRYSPKRFNASYSLIVGPKEGSPLELVMNTVFNYGISQGLVPYSVYRDLQKGGKLHQRGMVRYAIPQCRGDNYRNFPIIGTTDEMFTKFRIDVTEDKEAVHLAFTEGGRFEFDHAALEKFVEGIEAEAKKIASAGNGGGQGHVHFAIPAAWRKAVIGADVARRIGGVGTRFVPVHGIRTDVNAHLHAEAECTVVGVLARTGTSIDRSIYIPLSVFLSMDKHEAIRENQQKIAENVGLSAILVSCVRPNAAQNLRYDFQERQGAQGAVPFYEISKLLEIVGDSSKVLEVLSYVVLLVTASSVLLALYNTMNERRREIAIMRSLGARRGQISRIILQEAALVSLGAGVIGVAVSHLAIFFLSGYIELRTGISVDWAAFAMRELYLILGVGALGSLAGVLPAIKGARVPVAENLGPTS